MNIQINDVQVLLPVMARVLSALMVAPVFSQRAVPAIAKIVLAGFLSWLIVAPGGIKLAQPPAELGGWAAGVAGEVLLGLLLGFASGVVFWAVSMAGEMIGMQMGFAFGSTLHASLETSPIATGQLYLVIGTLLFLATGGHLLLLRALAGTFAVVPPFGVLAGGVQVDRVISMMSTLFSSAVQVALPVVGCLMLAEVILAFLTRVLPQLNAWVFGMPLKIGLGLFTLWISLPVLMIVVGRLLAQSPRDMLWVIR